MPNLPISGLPVASPLSGTEAVPVDQSGTTVQTTAQDIADLYINPVTLPIPMTEVEYHDGGILGDTSNQLYYSATLGHGVWIDSNGNYKTVGGLKVIDYNGQYFFIGSGNVAIDFSGNYNYYSGGVAITPTGTWVSKAGYEFMAPAGALYYPGIPGNVQFVSAAGIVNLPQTPLDSTGSQGTSGQVAVTSGGTWAWTTLTGGGTVTSITVTVPSFLSVSPATITTSGTFAITLATETANTVFAGPTSGAAATPTFRALTNADVPSLQFLLAAAGLSL